MGRKIESDFVHAEASVLAAAAEEEVRSVFLELEIGLPTPAFLPHDVAANAQPVILSSSLPLLSSLTSSN